MKSLTWLLLVVLSFCAFCSAQTVTPDQRADALIRKMTLSEKIAQLHGVTNQEHDRWVPGIERSGIPPLPMANGPAGIGPAGLIQPRATAFPAPIAVAASWDRADAHEYGAAVAGEIRAIGRTMLEAPTVNIARIFWQLPHGVEPTGIAKAVEAARHANVALVFAGAWSHEGFDRSTLALPGSQNQLIEAVAKVNPQTIVVLQSGEPVLMPWIHDVAAVVEAWFPGEEGGPAIAGVLAGDINPSGKLPITFPSNDHQVAASTPQQYPGINNVEHYTEGLNVGYRWFDAEKQTPLFPFGYGLSYTHFKFSKLSSSVQPDGTVAVHVTITNRGERAGAEVAQLYVNYPKEADEPPFHLRAFSKVRLNPGASKQLTFTLGPRAFSYWSVAKHHWEIVPGSYRIAVGSSSRDLPLRKAIVR